MNVDILQFSRKNKVADELARKGAFTTFVGNEPLCQFGSNTIKAVLKEEGHSKWAKHEISKNNPGRSHLEVEQRNY